MAKTNYINNWEAWKELCEHYDFDPYKTVEFGLDEGGGNSTDFEYIGDVPTDICTCSDCKDGRSE